jgi:hypothetical protein
VAGRRGLRGIGDRTQWLDGAVTRSGVGRRWVGDAASGETGGGDVDGWRR